MTKNSNHKQISALPFLLEGKTQKETASLLGVSRQTIGNWMKDRDFKAALKKRQMERIDQLSQKYQRAEDSAFDVVISILTNIEAKNIDRLRAAELIQKESHQYTYFQNLVVRIEEIEDWMDYWKNLKP